MKRWVCNIQKNWYEYVMQAKEKKLNRLILEGKKLTSEEVLEASRKIDVTLVRFHELDQCLKPRKK